MDEKLLNKGVKRLIWLCWFAYSMSYIGRLNFSACMAEIMATEGITKAYAGSVGTGFLACYGVGQLVNGLLGDRVSPKIMVGIGLFGAGCSNVLMGLNSAPAWMIVIWCLNGWFQSMLWSPVIRCFSRWLPKDRQQKAGVRLASTIPAGTIASYVLSSAILSVAGWRPVFLAGGALLVFASAVWFSGISGIADYIARMEAAASADARAATGAGETPAGKPRGLLGLIARTGLVFAVAGIFFNGILKDGVTLWVPAFITESFGVAPSIAAALSVLMPVVSLTGAYAAVWLNKKINNEMATGGVLFLVSAASFVLLYLFGDIHVVFAAVLFAVSLSSMLGVNSMLLTFIPLRFGSLGKSASVTGFLNACSYFASALSSVSIGLIAGSKGWNATVLSWLAVAIAGAAAGFAGKRFWGRGRRRIADGWGTKEPEDAQTV